MSTQITLDEFLDRFFAAPNLLPRATIEGGGSGLEVCARQWLNHYRQHQEHEGFLLLPCSLKTGKVIHTGWYALAFSERGFRDLLELLIAFVGPSYANFRGIPAKLHPEQWAFEQAIVDYAGPYLHVFKFSSGVATGQQGELVKALARMHLVVTERERHRRPVEKRIPVGRLLADFRLALHTGQRAEAAERMTALVRQGQLDAINQLFLRVQWHAAFGEWEALLQDSALPDLLVVRRPRAVTEALIEGIYSIHLACYEDQPTEACRVFRDEVLPQYADLYLNWAGMTSPAALASFMLKAVCDVPCDVWLRDTLLAQTNVSNYVQKLAALSTSPVPPVIADPMLEASRAVAELNYDYAAALVITAPESVARARILLACANSLQQLEISRQALEAFSRLANADQQELRQNRYIIQYLQNITATSNETTAIPLLPIPSNWLAWAEMAIDERYLSSQIFEFAEQGVEAWELVE
ncbi:MAG TPA: hypothetical protein VGK81_04255, partial [Anaerolineae bacterium]